MAASKLVIYNNALGLLGERELASLTENREPRRVLDSFYDNTIRYCLEQGNWERFLRSVAISPSSSVEPEFGFTNAFARPSDWIRTRRLSESDTLHPPLRYFRAENSYWYADCSTLYVEYVSNSASLGGMDLSRWTESFEDYVTKTLAAKICVRITQSSTLRLDLEKEANRALKRARSLDTREVAPQQQVGGSWARSRGGGNTDSRWDGTTQ